MKTIHVECNPDELLASKLGFSRKAIHHHQGKSRIFHSLKHCTETCLAIVDEDPGSVKTSYESQLVKIEIYKGLILMKDQRGNKIIVLKGKLEDWLINACEQQDINIDKFGLPVKSNSLHEIINSRLQNLNKLLDYLIEENHPEVLKLKQWLT